VLKITRFYYYNGIFGGILFDVFREMGNLWNGMELIGLD
jgi:hypothetical protein